MIDLKDKFGRSMRDLRVSVTDRCNFRCPYCMPAEIYGERYQFLARSEILTFEEIARLVRIFVGLGVTKVRLTGGEPLVRQGLEKLVAILAGIDGIKNLALTTNGYLLAQKALALKDAGLERRVGRPVKDPSRGPQRPIRIPLGYPKDSPEGQAELARRIKEGQRRAKLRKSQDPNPKGLEFK